MEFWVSNFFCFSLCFFVELINKVFYLGEIMTSVQAIRQDLMAEEHLKTIRNEWQMLAR